MKAKRYILFVVGGIFLLIFLTSCGKKKNPLLLLPNLTDSSSEPVKGDISLTYTNNEGDSNNTANTQNNNSTNTISNTSNSDNTQNNGSADTLSGVVTINDQTGNQDFNFNTTVSVDFKISVVDPSGPVSNAIVNITDPQLGNTILFQGITNENGILQGTITIPTNLDKIWINVHIGEHSAIQEVFVRQNNEYIIYLDRQIVFNQEVEEYINQVQDQDNDGIADSLDSYPDDPTRSTRLVLPNSGTSIVAYEDLYPNKGDADFNDVVLQVVNEEDLNSDGKIVRIRGKYKLLAKGAGYAHVIFLNLPGKGTFNAKIYNGNNQLVSEVSTNLNSFQQLPIFIRNTNFFVNRNINNSSLYFTNQLCSGMCNVYSNRPISDAYSSEIEIVFDEPISKLDIPRAPYDLYIYVVNTQKEVHFPGLFKQNNEDLYLDRDGFPWVLQIPVEWNWPLERNKIWDAYPKFIEWYQSSGETYPDWYLRFDENSKQYQFPYFNISYLSSYFLQFGNLQKSLLWTFLAIFISGILVFLFIKGRSIYNL